MIIFIATLKNHDYRLNHLFISADIDTVNDEKMLYFLTKKIYISLF